MQPLTTAPSPRSNGIVKDIVEQLGKVQLGRINVKDAEGTSIATCMPSRGAPNVKFGPR